MMTFLAQVCSKFYAINPGIIDSQYLIEIRNGKLLKMINSNLICLIILLRPEK